MPAAVNSSCPVLNLNFGPLDLNLLGPMVHLHQVALNITAIPGAGNLLGNLLCDVANLFKRLQPGLNAAQQLSGAPESNRRRVALALT